MPAKGGDYGRARESKHLAYHPGIAGAGQYQLQSAEYVWNLHSKSAKIIRKYCKKCIASCREITIVETMAEQDELCQHVCIMTYVGYLMKPIVRLSCVS